MERWDIQDAEFKVRLCRQVKDELYPWWNTAAHYWNNDFKGERAYDPEVLLSRKTIDRWGVDNLIPYAMRVREANIMTQPLSIKIDPYGASDDMLMIQTANGLDDLIHYFENRPEANKNTREVIRRAALFNAVMEYDWYDIDEFKEGPKVRVIPHNDIFMDINAIGDFNEVNGPRWCAVRFRITDDEAELMFPGVELVKGTRSEKSDEAYKTNRYDDRAEIYEWFGIDESRRQIPDAKAEATVLSQLNQLFSGGDINPENDEDHDFAIKYVKAWLIMEAEDTVGGKFDGEDAYAEAQRALVDAGMGNVAQVAAHMVTIHQAFIDEGIEGGTEPVYPGSIYRAVFQKGQAEPIEGPELYDYAHNQLPVSFYRSHAGSRRLFTKGIMTEVLTLQAELEWWEKARMDITNIAGRPPMAIPMDLMEKRLDKRGRGKLVAEIKKGFAVIWTSIANYQRGAQPAFIPMGGAFNLQVLNETIDEKRRRIFEIIGSTPVLRGEAPVGAEASGKRVQIQQAAAARPLNDALAMIEAPKQKRFERMVMNILQHASYELMESITGRERAGAIMQVREAFPGYRPIVKVDFGFGMPNDWYSKFQILSPFMMNGLIDPEDFSEILNLGVKLKAPPPAPVANPGQQAGTEAVQGAGIL